MSTIGTIGTIGVDLGGSNAVIAAAKRGGVEVITNEASHRETQVVVGFGEKERYIGEQAYVQLKSNFKNSIVFPTRFLGATPNSPFLNDEKKWLYNTLVTEDDKVAFEVTSQGAKQRFIPEQVVAMMLQKIKKIAAMDGITHSDMVLSVPSYFTDQERKALLDAAKIAGVNVLKLMNESTALALAYGIFRKNELTPHPRNVCFIDLGHCSASAFIAAFTKDKMTVLNQHHERSLGTRDFDWELLKFYAGIIKQQYGAEVISKDKARLRLLDAIEKQRKILSANSDATINVDCVAEDNDLSYTLTREKFEEIVASVVEKFRDLLLKLKAEIKVPLHSVEIVGGGTRIPIIQRIIQEVFGMDISRTLNASESIARGCAIEAAMLTPAFKVAPYAIEEANYHPIKCSWTFKKEGQMEIEDSPNKVKKQSALLFPKGDPIPSAKAITFHNDNNIEINIVYADPVPEGANPLIAKYMVHNAARRGGESSVKARVVLNPNGIIEFDCAKLLEEDYEDILAPGGRARHQNRYQGGLFGRMGGFPQQQEAEVRRKRKTSAAELKVDVYSFNELSEEKIKHYIAQENRLDSQDRLVQETHNKKNELESFVYDVRGRIGEKYDQFLSNEVKQSLSQELERIEHWLYNEGLDADKGDYIYRLEGLKKTVNQIEAGLPKV